MKNYDEFNEQELIKELNAIINESMSIQEQYELYCKMMKEMFLAGSTNN